MPQRHCSKTKTPVAKPSKRICIPISREEYEETVKDTQRFREMLEHMIDQYPELFPEEIKQGYQLYGLARQSIKMPDVRVRRICLNTPNEEGKQPVCRVVPSFVMPYMIGDADEVEKALYLRCFGVPFHGLTYVFGRDDRYWQRMVAGLGRNDIVGTTIKKAEELPVHLLADEKHTRWNGERAYIATTVAEDCVLGALLTLTESIFR